MKSELWTPAAQVANWQMVVGGKGKAFWIEVAAFQNVRHNLTCSTTHCLKKKKKTWMYLTDVMLLQK